MALVGKCMIELDFTPPCDGRQSYGVTAVITGSDL